MIVKLTDDEVRAALAKAVAEKTQHILGCPNVENCWFEVKDINGEVEDIESVCFLVYFN